MASLPAVLITGTSTGIGATCAQTLAGMGYQVLAGVRTVEDGERLAAHAPGRLQWLRLDVTDERTITAAVDTVSSLVGGRGLAGLVNNAGIVVGGPLEYIRSEELRLQFEVNVIGLHAVTAAFLPLIRLAKGRIINIGSISGRIASPFTGPYAASKHAVEALTDALRLELAPDGIQVSVIEPGQIKTPIWTKGLAAFGAVAGRIPSEGIDRYGTRLKVLQRMVERAPKYSSPPGAVVEAVVHALESSEPRTRYVVGRDAKIRLLLSRLLPDRLMDALVLRVIRRGEARFS